MKANKIVNIFDLTLNKPTAEIINVAYPWNRNVAIITVSFKEENAIYSHARNFEMDTEGRPITPIEITNFISKELKDFE